MTLEEKIGQLTQIAGGLLPGANPEEVVRKGGAGSILWLNDTKRFNEIQHVAVDESRLHIPVLCGLDVIHGYRTIFPVPLAMAASQVRGFQGPSLGTAPDRVVTCAKHFAGYGAPEGGRDYVSVYIPWAAEHVPAILEAWEPGTEGGNAVADVLFGDVNPGGKLPATFPRSGAQEPLYYAHNLTHQPAGSQMYRGRYWDGPTEPLYPFGYGLSYTTFEFGNLRTERPEIRVGDQVVVSVDVANTGKMAGDEVVQLYIHQRAGSDSRPVRLLKGFRRIHLAPGDQETVTLTLDRDELGYWSTSQGKWIQEAADFDLWAGGDSTASLHTVLKVVP